MVVWTASQLQCIVLATAFASHTVTTWLKLQTNPFPTAPPLFFSQFLPDRTSKSVLPKVLDAFYQTATSVGSLENSTSSDMALYSLLSSHTSSVYADSCTTAILGLSPTVINWISRLNMYGNLSSLSALWIPFSLLGIPLRLRGNRTIRRRVKISVTTTHPAL